MNDTPGQPSSEPNSQEPTAVAQGRALARTIRRLEHLDEQVAELARLVLTLADQIGAPAGSTAEANPQPPALRSWLLADDPELGAAALDDLTAWVWKVYFWYPDTWMSSCWMWHPDVVEELWCLRLTHADAFDPDTGTVLRMADWHDRQRPGVTRRVRAVLGKCELSRHVDRNGRGVDVSPPAPPALARHAADVAAVWAAGADLNAVRATGPEPTPEQLAEAEAHQNAHYRSRR